jgi:hypothetical protein
MSDQEDKQIYDTFLKSRSIAILRCTEIIIDSGRKDLAKDILATTNIDRARLLEIRKQYQLLKPQK